MIPRLHVPLTAPEDVVRHLGKQEKDWKEGRSAHALASVWFRANAFPPRIDAALKSHPDFQSAELVDAFFERQVDLGSEGRPSQTDLLAIIGLGKRRLAAVAVEAKAGESFDKLVHQWHDGSDGKEARLNGLRKILGLSREAAMPLRCQLLHRTASAILEARRYRTDIAVLLVHSFSDDEKGFADFSAFLQALGFETPAPGVLAGPIVRDGVALYAGWIQDKAPKDESPGAYLDKLRSYAAKIEKECKRVRAWCDEQQSKR
jgi:Domain of unknown function (DUF6946)